MSPLFATPSEVIQQALDADVHVVGVSTLAAGHRTLVPEIVKGLEGSGVIVVCGGVIPEDDHDELYGAGVKAVFGPGTNVLEAAEKVIDAIEKSFYKQKP
jgi:methylmalonyl-CoA mutase